MPPVPAPGDGTPLSPPLLPGGGRDGGRHNRATGQNSLSNSEPPSLKTSAGPSSALGAAFAPAPEKSRPRSAEEAKARSTPAGEGGGGAGATGGRVVCAACGAGTIGNPSEPDRAADKTAVMVSKSLLPRGFPGSSAAPAGAGAGGTGAAGAAVARAGDAPAGAPGRCFGGRRKIS